MGTPPAACQFNLAVDDSRAFNRVEISGRVKVNGNANIQPKIKDAGTPQIMALGIALSGSRTSSDIEVTRPIPQLI